MNYAFPNENLSSTFLKKELMGYLYNRLNYPVVIDEFQFMDVFGIRQSGYTVEFEIKISKSDFDREIKTINSPQPTKYSKDWAKWEKHANYLSRPVEKEPSVYDSIPGWEVIDQEYFIPSEFYFYVPDFLADHAIKSTIGLPYGVIKIGTHENQYGREYYSNYEVVKKAEKLCPNKADGKLYISLAHGLTVRNRLLKT